MSTLGIVGRACFRHRWITLMAWIAALACLVTLWQLYGAGSDNDFNTSDPGQTLLDRHFHQQSGDRFTLAIKSTAPVTDASVRSRVGAAIAPLRGAPHVTEVSDPYTHVSRNGHIAFATVQFDEPSASIPTAEVQKMMDRATASSGHGVDFNLAGDVVDTIDTPGGGSSDAFGVVAAMIVLLIAFGSLLAMGLPIATALFGIGTGLSLLALLGHLFPAPSYSAIIASGIGLGVGVDYALFIVTRFRDELRSGADPETATVTTMRTAGRSVLTAGATVVIGMLGLLVLRESLMNGVSVAASATVAMTVLASLTLLPALLGFSGTRLARPSRFTLRRRRPAADEAPDAAESGPHPAERWARLIQRRPVTAVAASTVVILALAAPALAMKLSMPDDSTQPRHSMGYKAYATMSEGFGPGFDAPLIVAAKLPRPDAAASDGGRIVDALRTVPGVAEVTPPVTSSDGKALMIVAYPTTQKQAPETNALVNTLNTTTLPRATAGTGMHAYLTGPNAGNVTFADFMGRRLPWVIATVVVLSVLLILAMFRSVVIALTAAVMNLLSVTASYGVLTAVAQWGWAGKLFGFPEKMPVTTWVPVFLFVILFGLSMDYEVFLLSRIREVWLRGSDNSTAVTRGLVVTARVITAAAAIMFLVFLGFVATPDVAVKQIGLGLAVAVLVDATIVRLVLVPAAMEVLGKANWWMPSWLDRCLPRIEEETLSGQEPVKVPTA
ncbi:MMPL family transporter [Streptomyces sp. NPDC001093]|uniref:MMPL family transporter n=1 Tax=Streptomyces sp. NPDC001093 TaxID=3154376 RepID=UPI00331E7FAE